MSAETDLIDVIIKGLALFGTMAFFGYKTLSGFNNQNLSLILKCERVPSRVETNHIDLVVLNVAIEKGTTAALALEALQARFSWGTAEHQSIIIPMQIGRFGIYQPDESIPPKVMWTEVDFRRPYLYMSPGEKTTFACEAPVPSDAVCTIEVVAVGRRRKSSFQAQWRASAVVPQRPHVEKLGTEALL